MRRSVFSSGFTLIELSVVLIIVGLLVGGVLVGRDLIRQSEIRSVFSDLEKIQSSILAFQSKYNYLPGDFDRAERFWGSDPGGCPPSVVTASNTTPKSTTCNGNANGKIDTAGWVACGAAPTAFQQEPFRLWQHLANAGLYSGLYSGVQGSNNARSGIVGVNIPKSSKLPQIGYQLMNFDGVQPAGGTAATSWFDDTYYYVIFIGRQSTDCSATQGYEPNQPFVSATEARSTDQKFDDGRPGTGTLRTLTNIAQSNCNDGSDYSSNSTTSSCSFIQIISGW
jgi:prepilin-type N-terminal cleavage/methylation domain-containing protein